ncbi:MAG: Mur ligase family protein [Candidatus Saccharimonadales bacterium]
MIPLISAPYKPRYVTTLVYMLQSTDYHAWAYLKWFWRTQDFSKVEHRRQLQQTMVARLLLIVLWSGMAVQVLTGLFLIYLWEWRGLTGGWAFGLALIISYPVIWAHLAVVPLVLGRLLIAKPRERWLVIHTEKTLALHKGTKIAIAGSYGKTSMKELLLTVLSEGKKIAATPANKNVPLSHAEFAKSLKGDEDIILIEYGEGAPGDVARFAKTTHPTQAIITGVSAAHLDRYRTIEKAGADIFSLTKYVKTNQVFVNGESPDAEPFIEAGFNRYDQNGALGWKVSVAKVDIAGLSFTLSKGQQKLNLKSSLLGSHNIGPLSLAATLAHQLGLTNQEIINGVGKAKPFEHRMQPYQLNDAWIIDDTYNGNLEGIRAGTILLNQLPAKRKLYITPGLVDQGQLTSQIHEKMGELIAASGAQIVVLMKHSVTDFIKEGLTKSGFQGELIIEPDPLNFYNNLSHFVAAGDLVLMQNDWPDNYV